MRVGVEIGGTFTDLILVEDDGTIRAGKVLSTPVQPQIGAMNALKEYVALNEIITLIHASTIGTNAIIQRNTAVAGLITTAGFGDVLLIQRHDRDDIYNPRFRKPEPIIPRDRVVEVEERIDSDGNVVVPLSSKSVKEAVRYLVEVKKVESIAVCLLFSFLNPEHEQIIGKVAKKLYPNCEILLSSNELPQIREYERTSTTSIAASLVPILKKYISALSIDLKENGFKGDFHIMQSNGGILPADQIGTHAIYTLNSGPAAGVTGALDIVEKCGLRNAITLDMGGTSADVCLIHNNRAELSIDTKISGLPVQVPMIDVVSIGAGGGSIAWVDEGTMLRVGPKSAGANPGPACYNLGGTAPTVTDANVALGLIRKEKFFGGKMELDYEKARSALDSLKLSLNGDFLFVADSIRRVVNSNMLQAIRLVSVERGFDPRDFYLIAFGGAGPLHAAELADELGMRGALVPNYPGLLSAFGLVVADFQQDFVRTRVSRLSNTSRQEIQSVFDGLLSKSTQEFSRKIHADPDTLLYRMSIDMRYTGQAFELTVPVNEKCWGSNSHQYIQDAFVATHKKRYGYAMTDLSIDIVCYRLSITAPVGSGNQYIRPIQADVRNVKLTPVEQKIFIGSQEIICKFISRSNLPSGTDLRGPTIIEELSSTTYVPNGWNARIDDLGNIWLEEVK